MKTDGRPYSEEEAARMEEIDELVKELAALEQQIAVKDKALLGARDNTRLFMQCAYGDYVENGFALEEIEAALTPDSGKVVVDREKLRGIQYQPHGPSDDMLCVGCFNTEGFPCLGDCWVAASLKDKS